MASTTVLVFASVAIVLGVVTARLFPQAAGAILQWFNRIKYTLLVLVGIAVAFYFLSSGAWFLIALGVIGLMLATWQFLFNNPLGWLRPFLPW